ncbi:hypothetical protein AB1N83_002276 [Pleurotus pulmonarius]
MRETMSNTGPPSKSGVLSLSQHGQRVDATGAALATLKTTKENNAVELQPLCRGVGSQSMLDSGQGPLSQRSKRCLPSGFGKSEYKSAQGALSMQSRRT